jgi:hypothetical protein
MQFPEYGPFVGLNRPFDQNQDVAYIYCNLPNPEESCTKRNWVGVGLITCVPVDIRVKCTRLRQPNHVRPCSASQHNENRNKCKNLGLKIWSLHTSKCTAISWRMQISGIYSFQFVSSFANFSIWLYGTAIFNLYTPRKRRFFLHRKIHISWDRALTVI